MEKAERGLLLPLSNEYAVSFRCNNKEKLFNFLHRLSPIIKLISLALVIPAIFYPYILIIAAVLFLLSMLTNYLKWYLIFSYEYIIDDDILTIKKTYNFIKPKIYLQTNLNDIAYCDIIKKDDAKTIEEAVICYCYSDRFDVYIKFTVNDTAYIILADNYFYSLIKKREDK